MTQRVSVSLPEASGAPSSSESEKTGQIIFTLLALVLGAAGGRVGHLYFEGTSETAFHAERLRPFLAYDAKFYERAARSMNDDHRRVQFLLHAAVADGCDLVAVLDAAMPTTQVPPALKKLTIDRLTGEDGIRSSSKWVYNFHNQACRIGVALWKPLLSQSISRPWNS